MQTEQIDKSVLSDGTRVEDLIDTRTREVSMRVVTDPEIYQLELDRLWRKAWVPIGHVTEVPDVGDFVTRTIGDDPVIVSRGRDGDIHVLLNVCQHRGMPVCRAELGNTKSFLCPYHGWNYGRDGSFLGSPIPRQRLHGDVVPKEALDLPTARVDTHAGIIFATFDRDAPPLSEHLGDAAWYLDLYYDRTEDGLEVAGPPQRFVVPGNWKLAAEQFVGGDSYHVITLHRSMYDIGVLGTADDLRSPEPPGMTGYTVFFPQGHSIRCVPPTFSPPGYAELSSMEKLAMLPPAGMTPDMVGQLEARMTTDQLRLLADAPPTVGGLFPHTATLNFAFPSADGRLAAVTGFHAFVPNGVDSTEFYHWTLVERSAPPEFKQLVRQTTIQTVGPSGMLEQDDCECWPITTRAARGSLARAQTLKYQALLGENRPDDWPGGGMVAEGFGKDDGQWQWWGRYFEFLTGKAW